MARDARKEFDPELFARSVAKLSSAWLGMVALAVTWVMGLLHGVAQPTALWRAVLVGLGCAFAGKVLGGLAGRSLARSLLKERRERGSEAEATT